MAKPKGIGIISSLKKDAEEMKEQIMKHLEGKVDLVDLSFGEEIKNIDLLICIGGDGTILRSLHSMEEMVPIVGINMGEIGFLAEVSSEEAVSVIDNILYGFDIEGRARLSVMVNEEELPCAMNEAVVITSRPSKMVHFAIYIDGRELEMLRADGVVFATPTGSTAYAMSAGGPIVDPRVDAIIIVPLAPFKLSARPSVVPATSEVQLSFLKAKDAMIVIDGQFSHSISEDDKITITKSDDPAVFVKTGMAFFTRVREMLIE
jgi:NAD+ kinase